MKKRIIILLIGILIWNLFGCAAQKPKLQQPVSFYYLPENYSFGTEDAVLVSEQREGSGIRQDLNALLTLYFDGPETPELRSPFPSGTTLLKLEMLDDTLHITLNEAFSELRGFKLTLACAAITKTCLTLSDCVNVQIYAENATLDGEKFILMNEASLLLLDHAEPQPTSTEPS